MKEIAYAKINLGLNILGKRSDGYHEVDMIMQTVSLADEIEITASSELLVTTDKSSLPGDKNNLAYKAAELLGNYLNKEPNVHIFLKKNIFLAAGLAGGSADAAAVLRGLNKFWQSPLSLLALEKLGSKLGSDVPFCIEGGTARATAKGEVLEALPDFSKEWLVLAKPKNLEVSTAWVYKNYKEVEEKPNINLLVEAIQKQDSENVIKNIGNVLESVTIPSHPIILKIKEKMTELGITKCLMSGSGPTVFGFAKSRKLAQEIAEKLRENKSLEIAVVSTIKRGEMEHG